MIFEEVPQFKRDLKKLLKRFRTLKEDLAVFKKALAVAEHPQPPQTFRLSDLGFERPVVIKVKRFASRSIKGKGAKTRIRIIYAFYPEDSRIKFVEIYHKGDKELEDRERINDLYNKTQ